MSLPTRERGLKYFRNTATDWTALVAPYTGAWIEIIAADISDEQKIVAPYTGAWIEITIPQQFAGVNASLPTRERGLKCAQS